MFPNELSAAIRTELRPSIQQVTLSRESSPRFQFDEILERNGITALHLQARTVYITDHPGIAEFLRAGGVPTILLENGWFHWNEEFHRHLRNSDVIAIAADSEDARKLCPILLRALLPAVLSCRLALLEPSALQRFTANGDDPNLVRDAIRELDELEPFEPREGELPIAKPLELLIDNLDSPLPAQDFVVENIVPFGDITLLGGHGGVGKSMLALALAMCVAGGTEHFLGIRTKAATVAYFDFENRPETSARRIQAIARDLGISQNSLNKRFRYYTFKNCGPMFRQHGNRAHSISETALFYAFLRAIEGVDFIIIDHATCAFDGDENKRQDVRRFIDALGTIAQANNAAILLLVHIDKHGARGFSNGNSYSGSSEWNNAVRSRLALVAEHDGVKLVHEKSNYGKLAAPVSLVFDDNGNLKLARCRRETDHEQLLADAKHVLVALEKAESENILVIDSPRGHFALENTDALPHHLKGTSGRRRVAHALHHLKRRELVSLMDVFYNGKRTKRYFLELTAKMHERHGDDSM